jgi:hypothetical protein
MSYRGAVHRWGPHRVVAGLEEDRRQRCTWRRSWQLGRRGAFGDRPEERSMVPVDGSVGNAVASEGNTGPLHGWHVEAAATRGAGIGGALARSEQRRLGALSHGARSEDAGAV